DTIYAEGQRRYVESLSAYARQFLGRMEKPDVDHIEGLSPAISIDQKGVSRNPRSTVGTVTEIYDYLRLLFARAGRPHCPRCGRPVQRQSVQQIVDSIMRMPESSHFLILAPLITHTRGHHVEVFENARREGFVRVRVDGDVRELSEEISLDRWRWHNIEIVVDRLVVRADMDSGRLADSVETALRLAKGTIVVSGAGGEDALYSENFACVHCDVSISELEPRNFSFNTPYGACPTCAGLGFRLEIDPDLVIPDKTRSLSEGALAPWERDGTLMGWYGDTIRSVAAHCGFSPDTPVKDLAPEHLDALLYGTKGERVPITHRTQKGKVYRWRTSFEGALPNLERRHEETESEAVREQISHYMTERPCTTCGGLRLKPEALAVTVLGMNVMDVTHQSVERALGWVQACRTGEWPDGKSAGEPLSQREQTIATQILKEIESRVGFLARVGLGYLTLDRAAASLSGGEGQRISLATQIGSGLMGVLYVCDEPSVGLHPVDNHRLITTLEGLRDVGNTVLIVEHDEAIMRAADHIVDLGPGAGEEGGHLVVDGTIDDVAGAEGSVTGAYLSGRRTIPMPEVRRGGNGQRIVIKGARQNNLKNLTASIPLGRLVVVTGVSGSGKSSLITEVLYKHLAKLFYRAKDRPGDCDGIVGLENIDKVIEINQSPIGRTPRSNPATYIGAFTPIRQIFATMPEARARGYKPGRFSFNVKGGRCEACAGAGYVQIEMQFLPDVTVPCEVCNGARYNREALEVRFKGKSIADVLNMTVSEAAEQFENIAPVRGKLRTMLDVGLGYMRMGQPATTLSGGEAQRVKLSAELSKRSTGRTLYILDEPTTGLSFEDCNALMAVLHRLVDAGNTVILIEHHLDLIKNADWILDLGPEAGDRGGELVAEGTPEFIASVEGSYTGRYLRDVVHIAPDPGAPGAVGKRSGARRLRGPAQQRGVKAAIAVNGRVLQAAKDGDGALSLQRITRARRSGRGRRRFRSRR
ncbi:MAG: excinuclease ABC subunit UvrA, partial [Chloroflexi bacterium]|nr:excinuclease ABC subunit UvrA [Chloroflexota bacterium]